MRLLRLGLLLVFAASPMAALCRDVKLQWDPNSETNLAGYKVYIGTASRTYGVPITIGLQPTYTVSGLAPGTYYFAVTASTPRAWKVDFQTK
jgi:hypothetical protein